MEQKIIDELNQGLQKEVKRLNENRNILEKLVKTYYFFLRPNESNIYVNNKRIVNIQINDDGLDGFISPKKSLISLKKYLIMFSYQHNIDIGNLVQLSQK